MPPPRQSAAPRPLCLDSQSLSGSRGLLDTSAMCVSGAEMHAYQGADHWSLKDSLHLVLQSVDPTTRQHARLLVGGTDLVRENIPVVNAYSANPLVVPISGCVRHMHECITHTPWISVDILPYFQ